MLIPCCRPSDPSNFFWNSRDNIKSYSFADFCIQKSFSGTRIHDHSRSKREGTFRRYDLYLESRLMSPFAGLKIYYRCGIRKFFPAHKIVYLESVMAAGFGYFYIHGISDADFFS